MRMCARYSTVDTSNQYNLIQSKWYMYRMEIFASYDKQTVQMNVNDKINCVFLVECGARVKNRKRMCWGDGRGRRRRAELMGV